VRVGGLDAGEVLEIHVPPGPSTKFRVRMRVREDLHPLIRVDSVASIQNDGLVGNKFVQIEAGSEQSPPVAALGTIHSREPFDLADLLQRMSETLDTVNLTIAEVKGQVETVLGTVSDTATDAQGVIKSVGDDVRTIMASTNAVTRDLTVIVGNVREGRGSIGKLFVDDSLFTSAKAIAAQAQAAMTNLKEATEQAKEAVADLRGEKGPVKGLAGNLQQTMALAKDAMQDLADNTEALKRNFLFRGFFNRRGYFDLHDVTVAQYREGALESKDRKALRIWASAAVLFATGANGKEELTSSGRARIDSAMSQFVRYPKTSPFVVEGYARADTGGERYLLSQARAQLVRDYVIAKFALDARFVAVMPMGAEAQGSPDGDRWDGVALAMFVPASGV
jgi:phospholipid/cholesterol/gamma-HCH transport system substrate-binding protein